jgi:hypothetical protein
MPGGSYQLWSVESIEYPLKIISAIWGKRTDRYSDERLEAMNSARGYREKEHRKIEMIHLGG